MLLNAHRKSYLLTAKCRTRFIALWFLAAVVLYSGISLAAPRDVYYEAETCYRSLRQDPKKIKYRHNWMRCIKKFQSVYKQDPDGPWAAAGLYMSAKLYQGLTKYSGQASDLTEARDLFERVVQRYPKSRYRQKSQL